MKCGNCGKDVPEQAKFCPFCGKSCKDRSAFGQDVSYSQSEMERVVLEAISGKTEAYEKLYQISYAQGFSVAMQMVKNEQDAMDLLQDAYISAFQHLERLQQPEKFKSWFQCIVANKCRDWIKKKKPDLFGDMKREDEQPDFEDTLENDRVEFIPEEQMDYNETKRLIKEILENLPEDQRLCVLMYYYDELSVNDIAATLQCSSGTVKSRLNYARKKIKEEVEALEKKGTKLYGIAPIPFFVWMLRKSAEQLPVQEALLQENIMPQILLSSAQKNGVHFQQGEKIASGSTQPQDGTHVSDKTKLLHKGVEHAGKAASKKAVVWKVIAGVVGAAVIGTSGVMLYRQYQEVQEAKRIEQEKQQKEKEKKEREEALQNLAENLDTDYLMKIARVLPNYGDVSEFRDYQMRDVLDCIFRDAYIYMDIHSQNEDVEYQNESIIKAEEMQYDASRGLYGGGTVICADTSLNQVWEAANLLKTPDAYVDAVYDEYSKDISYEEGKYEIALSGLGETGQENCEYLEMELDKTKNELLVHYKTTITGYGLNEETYRVIVLTPKDNGLGYEIVQNYSDPARFSLSEEEKDKITFVASAYDEPHKLSEHFNERTEYEINTRKDISEEDFSEIAGRIGYQEIYGEEVEVEDPAMEGVQKRVDALNAQSFLERTFDYQVSDEQDIEKVFPSDGNGKFIVKGGYHGSADTLYSFIKGEQTGANEYQFYVAVKPWIDNGYQTIAVMDITARKIHSAFDDDFVFEKINFKKVIREEWQQAYVDYILNKEDTKESSAEYSYNLIYIDDDDIPELFVQTTINFGVVVTYYNGTISEQEIGNMGMTYVERGGIFTRSGGRRGIYWTNYYKLDKGKIELIGQDKANIESSGECYWNDELVTEEELKEKREQVCPGETISPYDTMCTKDEILGKIDIFSVEYLKQ